eukprot:m.165107 g.165107  ORF g.165107 m.165107 type:complete len:391 (+) comp12513_c0_seq1:113-1285(+)
MLHQHVGWISGASFGNVQKPVVHIGRITQLNVNQLFLERQQRLGRAKRCARVACRDGPNGIHHHGRANRRHLVQGRDLRQGHWTLLHLHARVARELHQGIVGHTWEDRFTLGRDIGSIVCHGRKVGHAKLLNVRLRQRIDVQRRVKATGTAQGPRQEVGTVVTTDLDTTSATSRRPIKVLHDQRVETVSTSSIVGPNRHHTDHKFVLGRWRKTKLLTRPNDKGSDIERTLAVRGHPTSVLLHGRDNSFIEQIRWHLWHAHAVTTVVESVRIGVVWLENVNVAIFRLVGLQALIRLLSIVECRTQRRHADCRLCHSLAWTPSRLFRPCMKTIRVGRTVFKLEVIPVKRGLVRILFFLGACERENLPQKASATQREPRNLSEPFRSRHSEGS